MWGYAQHIEDADSESAGTAPRLRSNESPRPVADPGPSQQGPASAATHPASHLQPIEEEDNDAASTASEAISTLSLTDSILEYRTIHGRTYHRAIGNAQAWEPNDERHVETMDINHHMCLLMLDGKLFLAPLEPEKIQRVLDVGSGTGLWAIDFAEKYPHTQVTGTDVSPIQPPWVPPNLQFELDDANLNWTWDENTFDFIHIRFLAGNIVDWNKLYRDAFRCCKPGGWIEHQEPAFEWYSDTDGGIPQNSALHHFSQVYWEGGKRSGRSFRVVEDDLQERGMEAAGFVDIKVRDIIVPVGNWPEDPRQKELGKSALEACTTDIEGYLNYMCNAVMGWTPQETMLYCAHLRLQLRDGNLRPYAIRRVVYGRKPERAPN